MRKFYLLAIFSVFGAFSANSQQYTWDFGLNMGAANYLGEIGGSEGQGRSFLLDMKIPFTRYTGGIFVRKKIFSDVSLKFEGNYVRIAGQDSLTGAPERRGRNLSFRTDVFEAALTAEYYFYQIDDMSRTSKHRIDFKSYLYAGFGAALYYPQAYSPLDEKWHSLRPLMTEGEENHYDEMTFIIPYGAGVNFTFNKEFRFGMQIVYRATLTDYLDDISTDYAFDHELPEETFAESKYFANRTAEAMERERDELPDPGFYNPGSIRGNDDDNDGYLMVQITASYVLKGGDSFRRAKYNSIINRRRRF